MDNQTSANKYASFHIFPVGYVKRNGNQILLEILPAYVSALKQLNHFSHAQVFWWAGNFQSGDYRQITQTTPPFDNAPLSGIFATRSPVRPNPIALTTVKILAVNADQGTIGIADIDAYDGTPIVDIKAHFPPEDRVQNVLVPEWMAHWSDWLPETGLALRTPDHKVRNQKTDDSFSIRPLGQVRIREGRTFLEIEPIYAPAMQQLKHFSHVRLLWWFHRFENKRFREITQGRPPYENAPVTGVFASRSPVRPNPIGMTTARVIRVDPKKCRIEINNIDAYDKTPVIDLKPYIPGCDRVQHFHVPKWVAHWPEWWSDARQAQSVTPDLLRSAESDRLATFHLPDLQNQSASLLPRLGNEKFTSADSLITSRTGQSEDQIIIRGARQHNLKNIDVTIPRHKFVVITGVSGSGKSSLAFDTLYAEGRRRYLESFSTLARRLVDQLEKPKVDQILGLNPTLAIEQKPITSNPRSTVGTITEVYSFLRVLFARMGTMHCPQCGRGVKPQTARQITENLQRVAPETHIQLLAPLSSTSGTSIQEQLQKLDKTKYSKIRLNGKLVNLATAGFDAGDVSNRQVELLVAHTTVPPTDEPALEKFHTQLSDAVEETLRLGNGRLLALLEGSEVFRFSQHRECSFCNVIFFELTPALFSFNNPDGVCPDCNGIGVKLKVDPDLIVTQPQLSLLDGASSWYGNLRQTKPSGNWMRSELFALADHLKVDLELPWNDLPAHFQQAALFGTGDEIIHWSYDMKKRGRSIEFERPVQGAVNNIKRLLQQTSSEIVRKRLLEFMRELPCSTCQGERLCAQARFVSVAGKRFPEVATMTVAGLHRWLSEIPYKLDDIQSKLAGEFLSELVVRLGFLLNVGLHYLTLNRPVPTLSGGEGQRIRLANQLGGGLMGMIYVLDEPSIGLHPRDHRSLLDTLRQLRDAGNTLVVVEHDADTMRAADWLIDLGPGAGSFGGEIIAAGTPESVAADPNSLTGKYLSGALKIEHPRGNQRRKPTGWLTILGARLHNLKNIDVRIPLGVLTCVTGVSGSGKSSLIAQTLAPALFRDLHGSKQFPGPHQQITGLEQLDKVINITQAAIGRTPRSNPATYVEVFDVIRKLFAKIPEARNRGYKANRFSFNSKGGRCEVCQGYGKKQVQMHFLPDAWIRCQECDGLRYNRQTLEIKYKGKSIAEVLDLDVSTARKLFAEEHKITRLLQTLQDVGLDYIKLGQSALSLSGGEAQRVKLAKELGREDTGRTLYMLDEPTTGLHFADIQKLLNILHHLTDAGNTVIIVEHNLNVMQTSDWIIDLGPEGGEAGGYLVAEGTPEMVMQVEASYTGRILQEDVLDKD